MRPLWFLALPAILACADASGPEAGAASARLAVLVPPPPRPLVPATPYGAPRLERVPDGGPTCRNEELLHERWRYEPPGPASLLAAPVVDGEVVAWLEWPTSCGSPGCPVAVAATLDGEVRFRQAVAARALFLTDGLLVASGSHVLAAFDAFDGAPRWELDLAAIAARLGITPPARARVVPEAVPLQNGTVRLLLDGEPSWAVDVVLANGEILRHHALGSGQTHELTGDGEGTLHRQGEELVRLGLDGAELFRTPGIVGENGHGDGIAAVGDGVVQLGYSNRLLSSLDGSELVARTVTNSYGRACDLMGVSLDGGSALIGGGVVRLLDVVGLQVHSYDAVTGAELGVVLLDTRAGTDDNLIGRAVLTSDLGFAALHVHSTNLIAGSGPPYRAVLAVAPLEGRSRLLCLPPVRGRKYGHVLTLAPGLAWVVSGSSSPLDSPFVLHALEVPLAPAAGGWVALDGDGAGGRRPKVAP